MRGAVAEEREVDGVHHQLDRQEDRDGVAAQERPGDADAEERSPRRAGRRKAGSRRSRPLLPPGEDEGADERGEQQDRDRLEGEEVARRRAGAPRPDGSAKATGSSPAGAGMRAPEPRQRRRGAATAKATTPRPPRSVWIGRRLPRPGAAAEVQQHEDEEEEDEDRAGVDDDLDRRDEGRQQHDVGRRRGAKKATTSASTLRTGFFVTTMRPPKRIATAAAASKTIRAAVTGHILHISSAATQKRLRSASGRRTFQPRRISWS